MYETPLPTVDWLSLAPLAIVVVTGMLALLIELVRPKQANSPIVAVTLIGLVAAFVAAAFNLGKPELESFGGMVVRDGFGVAMTLILLAATLLSVLFSEAYLRSKRIPFGEFYPLVLWSASGTIMMATTRNLLMIFIGLEVLSIALYVLTGMSRKEEKSEEAAIKYFLLGAFATGFLLYGISFVYGATGGLHLSGVVAALNLGDTPMRHLLMIGLALILVGLCFKSSMVPFHQWTPDVYQGSPTNVTAFMSAASKIGALAALWRVLEAFGGLSSLWLPVLFWVAILTMTVGNLVALVQKDVKRILAYSSIAHAGYILVAILAHARYPNTIGYGALTYYLLSYSLMTIGSFAVISLTARDGKESTRLEDLRGLWQRSPLAAACLVVFMISLVGLPPTSGFFGKLFIFNDALRAGLVPLAAVLAVNSVISCYYYLGIAKAAFVSDSGPVERRSLPLGLKVACLACAVGIFAAVVFVAPLQSVLSPIAPTTALAQK